MLTIPIGYHPYFPVLVRLQISHSGCSFSSGLPSSSYREITSLVTSGYPNISVDFETYGAYEVRFAPETDTHKGLWSGVLEVTHLDRNEGKREEEIKQMTRGILNRTSQLLSGIRGVETLMDSSGGDVLRNLQAFRYVDWLEEGRGDSC